jgi:hypothetical protein
LSARTAILAAVVLLLALVPPLAFAGGAPV